MIFTVLYHRDDNVPALVLKKLELVTPSNAHHVCVCVRIIGSPGPHIDVPKEKS